MIKKATKLQTIAILSLSLLTMAIGATAGTISEISREFPHVTKSTIELTVTMPSITMAIFIIFSNFFTKKFGTKKAILIGLSLVFISTILSMLSINISMLLAARAILGMGIGMFNSLAVSLIDYLYSGREREKLLGYQNTFQGIGATGGALLVSGLLAIANWRLTFIIYIICVPILFLNWRFVPSIRYTAKKTSEAVDLKLSKSAGLSFSYYLIILFVLMVAYMTINIKVPSFIAGNHFGTPAIGSLAIVIMSVGTILGGLMYGKLANLFGRVTMVITIALMVTAFLIIILKPGLPTALLGTFIIGYCFGLYVPLIFSRALSIMPPSLSNDGSTFLLIGSNLANFLCPYLDEAINPGTDDYSLFAVLAIILSGLLLIELWNSLWVHPVNNLH